MHPLPDVPLLPPDTDRTTLRRGLRISVFDGIFAVQYTTLTAGTLLTTFLLALGVSEFQIGLVASFPLLGGLLQPVGAEVIRRGGGWRKPVLLSAAFLDNLLWLLSLTAVVLLPPRQAIPVVIAVLAVQQMLLALASISWTSWISDLIPARLRGRYFGRRNFICNALGALTAIAAGQVVRLTGGAAVPVFLGLIGAGMAFRLVSLYFLSRQPEPCPAHHPDGSFFRQLSAPLRDAGFRRYLLYGAAWGFSVQFSAPFFTVYMIREAGLPVSTVMIFAGMATISNLLGQRFWGPLCDRYGDHQVLRTTGLAVVLQPLWWLFTSPEGAGYYLMALLSITGGFAWSGVLLANANLMMRLAPQTGKTTFFAVQGALGGLFGALGPLAGGLLASAIMHGALSPSGWLFEGLKLLFFVSFALRLAAWGLLHRVPEAVRKPRLRTVVLLRDAVRSFNPVQGFSPLLHPFMPATLRRRAER